MKVKLPNEVAQAIEEIRETKATNRDIVYTFAWDTKNGYPELVAFAFSKLDTLMQALVNGYEVEETPVVITITPEQKASIIDYYQTMQSADAFTQGERTRHKNIMTVTLKHIGIEWEELK